MQIHSRKMNVNTEDVNFDELARCTEDFNGAQLKAVCVEAGMLALRREANEIGVRVCVLCASRLGLPVLTACLSSACLQHEDFMEGVTQVQAKKKASLAYYA